MGAAEASHYTEAQTVRSSLQTNRLALWRTGETMNMHTIKYIAVNQCMFKLNSNYKKINAGQKLLIAINCK